MTAVRGEVQKEGLVVHIIARQVYDMTPALLAIASGHDLGDAVSANADEARSGPRGHAPGTPKTDQVAAERKRLRDALPSGRNFH